MGDTKVRIASELYEEIKKLAEKQNRSMREVVEEAIRLYLFGQADADKPPKSIKGKIIQLSFPTKCVKCGRKLEPGDVAYWSRVEYEDGSKKTFILCLDCYYQRTALAKYYVKKRELEIALQGLREEVRQLSEKAVRLKVETELAELAREAVQAIRALYDYVEDKQRFVELMEKLEDTARELRDRLGSLKLLEKRKKEKKRKRAVVEEEGRKWVWRST
jgi:DNA-binding protein H-NS